MKKINIWLCLFITATLSFLISLFLLLFYAMVFNIKSENGYYEASFEALVLGPLISIVITVFWYCVGFNRKK